MNITQIKGCLKVVIVMVAMLGSSPSVWASGDMNYCDEFRLIHESLARIEGRQYEYHSRITAVETKAVLAGASTSLLIAIGSAIWIKTHFKEK